MIIKFLVFGLFPLVLLSCSLSEEDVIIKKSSDYLKQCEVFIESKTDEDVSSISDFSYIYFFEHGVIVTFTKGEVGSFFERDDDYKQLWACGFYKEKLVYVSAPLAEPILISENDENFEDYSSNVKELLFRKVGDKFEYCCQQLFNPEKFNKIE